MSNEQPLALTGKRLARVISDDLKWMGFRSGAPIVRASADFTLDQALRGIRTGIGDEGDLAFVVAGGEIIKMHIRMVRNYALWGNQDLLGDLFGEHSGLNCFVIEGLLRTPDSEGFATAEAYELSEGLVDSSEDDVRYLKVLALVVCDKDGKVIDAIVQKVPSPADEILTIPPR